MPDGKTLGFAYANLDRAAIQRTDPTWLAKRLDDPASRFVCFIGERPAIDVSAPNVRVVQYTGKEVRDAGCQSEPVLLGIDDAGKALFAVQSEPGSDDNALPGDHKLIDRTAVQHRPLLHAATSPRWSSRGCFPPRSSNWSQRQMDKTVLVVEV